MEHLPAPLKYTAICLSALAITALCFFLMQFLIATDMARPEEIVVPKVSAPVIPPPAKQELREVRSRPDRVIPADLPPHPEGVPIAPEEVVVTVNATRPTFGSVAEVLDPQAMDLDLFPPVSDLIPLYVVQPVYPFKAVVKEIEGFVVVNFNVRENGTVINPVVVESEPDSLFDDAALSAVSKFRFKPRMVGGDAVAVTNLKMKFVFQMESPLGGAPTVKGEVVNEKLSGLN